MLDDVPTDHAQRADDQGSGAVFVQPATGLLRLHSGVHMDLRSFILIGRSSGTRNPYGPSALGVGGCPCTVGVDGSDGSTRAWRRRNSDFEPIASAERVPPAHTS